MSDLADKLAYFQAVTGIDDVALSTEILSAHDWDLQLAISSIMNAGNGNGDSDYHRPSISTATSPDDGSEGLILQPDNNNPQNPNLAWKLITLPFSIISASLGLVFSAIGFGMWAAGGALSFSLGLVGLNGSNRATTPSFASEAVLFVNEFESEYGRSRTTPNFVAEGFMDALQRSRREYKLMFVYLHSPEHHDTEMFCERTLCDERLAEFLNENFVIWGGSVKSSEGFKMSNSFKASRYPFCAVVMAATDQRIAMLQQVEGPKSPEEMITILQSVLEESAPVLVSARIEAEERRNNLRLREEQDAAYRAALEADQARERQRKEEQERLEREAAEAERKRKEEEEALEKAAREAAEREAALAKIREQKALSLGAEPDKGSDVTQVLVRFPSGERKDRRFPCTATVKSLYDYVDSLGCLDIDGYSLVSNFPRTVYGRDKLDLSLKEAGLHPQASLFVEMN